MPFALTSPAFDAGGAIPAAHTCEGADTSPPLRWTGAPDGVSTFALVVDDPDAPAGTFVHWTLYDIPGHFTELPADVGTAQRLENLGEAAQGENDFGSIGWRGPCPPAGRPHRYVFRLDARGARLELDPGVAAIELRRAMEGHVVGVAELTGTFGR